MNFALAIVAVAAFTIAGASLWANVIARGLGAAPNDIDASGWKGAAWRIVLDVGILGIVVGVVASIALVVSVLVTS